MGSGFYDWVYWHFFTITVYYNSSHIELLNNVCLTNFYEESPTNPSLISDWSLLIEFTNVLPFVTATRPGWKSPPARVPLLFSVNAFSRNPYVNSQATVGFLSVYSFQFPYPWKPCFVISWFPGISLSVATCLPIRFLVTTHMSQY
jgi:hypothetical protein